MSGHSKWSSIKRQKHVNDQARGKLFTKLASAITLAVREGGGKDPTANFRLRLAIEKAKEANMPKNNIERAIERAAATLAGENSFEEILYEGFGPGGIVVLVEVITDNRQRAISQIKNVLHTHGGSLGSSGSVAYQFTKQGALTVDKTITSDQLLEIALAVGATDFDDQGTAFTLYTEPSKLHTVKETLIRKGVTIIEAELLYKPVNTIPVSSHQETIIKLLTALDELDDVSKVHTNAEFI